MKYLNEIKRWLRVGDYEQTPEGVLIHGSLIGRGKYVHTVNGEDERVDYNLIPSEGILHILNVCLGATSKISAWYLAPYANAYDPVSGLTYATFASTAGELTTGYAEATRRPWTVAPAAAGKIGNLGSRATFTIVTGSTQTINGAGLVSNNAKGLATGGHVLVSATRFSAARILNNSDTFELGYEVELTDS